MPNNLLVKLTDQLSKLPFYLDAANIRMVTRNEKNPLETVIQTYSGNQNGPICYGVAEGVEEAGRLINAARTGRDLSVS